ncbi:ADP-ribosylglycohydrolase family protein [Ilyobacter polytropus]|uniref:ADP-ribosylation/Crystallin J1 n=1 Tax=Ilyobacter polytropus (strain ATCC 51220 / DSM 2926 / LMG 16218 / CuHBu1) TaxID=572544 RepID=E3H8K7_ILYPC|nr:ADP-ribosylglycohydrolase family protein [Ilyobacter polytropus]ADO82989.1 ADP-ribosylation/Crystallin J1 [Ilyobacter polytropus DSM 2926]
MSKKGLLLGSVLADAFSLGGHWIYDTEKIKNEFGEYNDLNDPLPDSFHKNRKKGEHTHYGDQTLLLLEYLAEKNEFDKNSFRDFWEFHMKKYDGYMDHATKKTLEMIETGEEWGSDSNDLAGASRIAPIIYCFSQDKGVEYSKVQTKITHDNEQVIAASEFFARTAYRVLEGIKPDKAMEEVSAQMENKWISEKLAIAKSLIETETVEAVKKLGQSCSIEGAFPATILLILKYSDNYEEAMIKNVMSGGDSAARGLIAGMIIGAYSEATIPKRWLKEMGSLERVNF